MILFTLATIGMTHILVDSEIMTPVDAWAEKHLPATVHHGVFECYQCSGFWCGMILGYFLIGTNVSIVFACGCAGSFLADLGKLILDRLEGVNATA